MIFRGRKMSVVILRQKDGKVWFGYSCRTAEGFSQDENCVCDLSALSIQIIPFRGSSCLVYYGSDLGNTERMVLRNILPELVSKASKMDRWAIVNCFMPEIEDSFRKAACLHTSDNGKDVRLGGSFVLASSDGIIEVNSNRDVCKHEDFYASSENLVSSLFAGEGPLSIDKAKTVIDTDSWHYYAGHKIYDPMIVGWLGDATFLLSDFEAKPRQISKEELECL
jgi:hypothetical protein